MVRPMLFFRGRARPNRSPELFMNSVALCLMVLLSSAATTFALGGVVLLLGRLPRGKTDEAHAVTGSRGAGGRM